MEFVEVGGTQYRVIKTGRAQAEQVLALTRWFSKYGFKAVKEVKDIEKVDADNGLEFLGRILEALDADALIDLFQALVGCPKEDAEVYFDVALLIEVLIEIFEHQPAVRRLVERFFSERSLPLASDAPSTT